MSEERNKNTGSAIVDLIEKVDKKKLILEKYLQDNSQFVTENPVVSWVMQVQSTFELYLKKYTLLRVLLSILNRVETISSLGSAPDSDSDTKQYVSSYMELYVLNCCCTLILQSFPKFSYEEVRYVAHFPVTMSNLIPFAPTKTGRLVTESSSLIDDRMQDLKSKISCHVTEDNLNRFIDDGFRTMISSIVSLPEYDVLSMTAFQCLAEISPNESHRSTFQDGYLSISLLSFDQDKNTETPHLRVSGHDCKNAFLSPPQSLRSTNISISPQGFFSELFKPSTEKTAAGKVMIEMRSISNP